jgi:hypothetical protein
MLPAFTCRVKVEVKSRGSPSFRERTSSTALRFASSKWSLYAIISFTRCVSAAWIISSHSATLTAIGFSHST